MKKVLSILFVATLVLGMVGSTNALVFTHTQNLNATLGEGPIAQMLGVENTYSYSHATPAGFEVPWDVVTSATLEISGYWIDGDNDQVGVNGSIIGTLTPGGSYAWSWNTWSWVDTPSISSFNIAGTFSQWISGSPLNVVISANGGLGDEVLVLAQSTFTLNYENGTASNNENGTASVPEPTTVLLLGAGLLGLVAYGRKRSKKN